MGLPVAARELLSGIIGEKAVAFLPEYLADVLHMTHEDLVNYGLTEKQAEKVISATTLAKAIVADNRNTNPTLSGPGSACKYFLDNFSELANFGTQEEFWVVTLDTKNKPIRKHLVTRGTLCNSLVHPREVFRAAILDSARSIVVMHNHPSGDTTPSDQDISVTERLEEAANIIGIPVIDHIIIGSTGAISIQDWRSASRFR